MTVETTIQQMFDEYPDRFSTRQECYDFLFCAIGNGYEWRRGQIVRVGNGEEDRNIQMWEEMDYADSQDTWESAAIKPKAVQPKTNIAKRRKENGEIHNLKRENDLEVEGGSSGYRVIRPEQATLVSHLRTFFNQQCSKGCEAGLESGG